MLVCLRPLTRNRIRPTRRLKTKIQPRSLSRDVALRFHSGTPSRDPAQSRLSRSDGTSQSATTEKTSQKRKSPRIKPEDSAKSNEQTVGFLERILPAHLRAPADTRVKSRSRGTDTVASLAKLLITAKNSDSVEILAELGIRQGRWPAVAWILEKLVAGASPAIPQIAQMPSNLHWPEAILDDRTRHDIELGMPVPQAEILQDGILNDGPEAAQDRSLELVWMTLGCIVVRASDLPSEEQRRAMSCVHRTIALLHKRGVIPDQIYANPIQTHGTFQSRPQLLHLLSSQILTVLSDASWEAHRDEWIAQAVEAGQSQQEAERNAPGGPVRLLVQHLAPEVWLELVLWCCADGGFLEAGCWIMGQMRAQKDPWSAVRHTQSSQSLDNEITGLQKQTISVEIVLGFIELVLESRAQEPGDQATLQRVSTLVSFLEPHDLPPDYLDYISVRLEQSLWQSTDDAVARHRLAQIIQKTRGLDRQVKRPPMPTLALESIFDQSEVYPGILHQVLQSFCVLNRLHPTLEIFNSTQELTDQSKLRSVDLFLKDGLRSGGRPRPALPFSQEYTSSHGQLPAQKYGLLLRTLTDAGRTRSAQWLVYSTDVDGPSIPSSLYSQLSLSEPILGLAQATGDFLLMHDIAAEVASQRHRPSVGFLRRFADAQLAIGDLKAAGETFSLLKTSLGGGNDLRNVASIMAMILRLEKPLSVVAGRRSSPALSHALALLEWLLQGDFRGIAGDFRPRDIDAYRQGLSCLLRVAEALSGSALSQLAQSWIRKLGATNVVGLNSRVFDILLSAVVDCRGAHEGMILWDAFGQLDSPTNIQETDSVSRVEPISQEKGFGHQKNGDIPFGDVLDTTGTPLSGSILSPNDKTPIVRPSLRTLGIIIRAALGEMEFAKKLSYAENSGKSQNSTQTPAEANVRHLEDTIYQTQLVEKWARPLFRRFGLSDEDARLEFGGGLGGQSDLFPREEMERKLRDAQTEHELARMGMLSHLSDPKIGRYFSQ